MIYTICSWDISEVTVGFVLNNVKWWIFNSTFYTIWFMPSLAVGILIAYFLVYVCKLRWALVISGILFAVGSLQLTYSFVLEDNLAFSRFINLSSAWLQGARGGFFFGAPLVILGALATRIKWRNPIILSITSIVSLILLTAEAVVLKIYVGGCGLDLAIFMLPLCLSLTMFLTSVSWNGSGIYKWMRSMSVLVFMSQRLFLTVIPKIFPKQFNDDFYANPYLSGLIVCGAVMGFSALILLISKRIKFLRNLY